MGKQGGRTADVFYRYLKNFIIQKTGLKLKILQKSQNGKGVRKFEKI